MMSSEPRGKRLKSNLVKIRVERNGQVRITIPKSLADSEGFEHGEILEFGKSSGWIIFKRFMITDVKERKVRCKFCGYTISKNKDGTWIHHLNFKEVCPSYFATPKEARS